mmetsp:Transcript_2278/g.3063  ORF Transcript_2278/g.3063 Transcript_2278/m.3063 type:complete len:91 (-) Transcript_2278:3399-3671(-)
MKGSFDTFIVPILASPTKSSTVTLGTPNVSLVKPSEAQKKESNNPPADKDIDDYFSVNPFSLFSLMQLIGSSDNNKNYCTAYNYLKGFHR